MKALKIIGIVILSVLLLGGIIYFISKTQNDSANASVFKSIPEEADAIVVINLEAFMTLALTNISDLIELSEGLKGEKDMENFQNEAQLSGINLSRKVAIYLKDDRFNVLVPVKSKTNFKNYLDEMVAASKLTSLSDTEYYSSDLQAYINYNSELCFISQMGRSEVEEGLSAFNEITAPKTEEFSLNEYYLKLQDTDEHLAFCMKEDEMAFRSPVFEKSPFQFTELTFEDGLIRVVSQSSSNNPDVKNPLKKGGRKALESEYLSFHVNLNPDAELDYWLTEKALNEWNKELSGPNAKASSKEFIEKWNGLFNFCITGSKTSLEEVITYDYDDNFNLVEKKKLMEQASLDYEGYIGFDEPLSSNDFLKDQIENDNLYFSQGQDNSLSFSSSENFTTNTENSDHALHLVAYPGGLIDLGSEVGLPFIQIADRFKDIIRKIELTANPADNSIESELLIYTGDKDKNSLIFLASEMRRYGF